MQQEDLGDNEMIRLVGRRRLDLPQEFEFGRRRGDADFFRQLSRQGVLWRLSRLDLATRPHEGCGAALAHQKRVAIARNRRAADILIVFIMWKSDRIRCRNSTAVPASAVCQNLPDHLYQRLRDRKWM